MKFQVTFYAAGERQQQSTFDSLAEARKASADWVDGAPKLLNLWAELRALPTAEEK